LSSLSKIKNNKHQSEYRKKDGNKEYVKTWREDNKENIKLKRVSIIKIIKKR